MHSKWPYADAQCSGVLPSCKAKVISQGVPGMSLTQVLGKVYARNNGCLGRSKVTSLPTIIHTHMHTYCTLLHRPPSSLVQTPAGPHFPRHWHNLVYPRNSPPHPIHASVLTMPPAYTMMVPSPTGSGTLVAEVTTLVAPG